MLCMFLVWIARALEKAPKSQSLHFGLCEIRANIGIELNRDEILFVDFNRITEHTNNANDKSERADLTQTDQCCAVFRDAGSNSPGVCTDSHCFSVTRTRGWYSPLCFCCSSSVAPSNSTSAQAPPGWQPLHEPQQPRTRHLPCLSSSWEPYAVFIPNPKVGGEWRTLKNKHSFQLHLRRYLELWKTK